jgi:hypothetical protein
MRVGRKAQTPTTALPLSYLRIELLLSNPMSIRTIL